MTRTRRSLILALVAGALLVTPAAGRAATAGQLHPLFTPFAERIGPAEGDETATGVAIAPSGRIVASVFNDAEIDRRVLALAADGARDLAFSGDGTWSLPQANETLIRAIAVQPDGKTVFVGDDASLDNLVIGRLMTDGELDPTFGGGDGLHISTVPADGSQPRGEQVIVMPDGRILFGGSVIVGNKGREVFVGRLTASGTTDSSFHGNPYVTFGAPQNGVNDAFAGLVRMPNGELIVASSSQLSSTGIFRIGGNGEWVIVKHIDLVNTIDMPLDLVAVSNTQVMALVTGTEWRTALARFDVANTPKLDTAFGTGGIAAGFPSSFLGQQLLREPNGAFVIAGVSNEGGTHRAVARAHPSGALDHGFAGAGIAHLPGDSAYASAMRTHEAALDVDGSIVMASHVGVAGERRTSVDRIVNRVARVRSSVTTASTNPIAGTELDVVLRASNDGPDDAGATAISFALSADLELRGASGAVCLHEGANGGICRFPSLAGGGARQVTLRVRSLQPGARAISMRVAGTTYDDVAADDAAALTLQFAAPAPVVAKPNPTPSKGQPDKSNAKQQTQSRLRIKLKIQRVSKLKRGRVIRCGTTMRKACRTARVRDGRRTRPLYLRASSTPLPKTRKRTIDVVLQRKEGRRWRKRGGGDLQLTRKGIVTFDLPTDMRGKRSVWRIRTYVSKTSTTRAVRSKWFYISVR